MTTRMLVLGLAMAAAAPAAAATLIGASLTGDYRYNNVNTVYDQQTATPPSFTVGAGVEQVVNIEGVTDFAVDFTATRLRIGVTTSLATPTLNDVPFNGLVFTGAALNRIRSITVEPSSTFAFSADRVVRSDGLLGLDFARISYRDGQTLDLTFSVVPEPGTWAMMILGFGLVGAAMRRQRRAGGVRPSAAPAPR